jgi:hypothetical protein
VSPLGKKILSNPNLKVIVMKNVVIIIIFLLCFTMVEAQMQSSEI